MLATPSSIWPLQLSSLPLQTSAGGTVWAMMPTLAAFVVSGSAGDAVVRRQLGRRDAAVGDDVRLDVGLPEQLAGLRHRVERVVGDAARAAGQIEVGVWCGHLVAGLAAVGDQDDDVLP